MESLWSSFFSRHEWNDESLEIEWMMCWRWFWWENWTIHLSISYAVYNENGIVFCISSAMQPTNRIRQLWDSTIGVTLHSSPISMMPHHLSVFLPFSARYCMMCSWWPVWKPSLADIPDGWVFRSKCAFSNSNACGVNDVRRFRFFDGSTPMNSVKWFWPLL